MTKVLLYDYVFFHIRWKVILYEYSQWGLLIIIFLVAKDMIISSEFESIASLVWLSFEGHTSFGRSHVVTC
jgi:hypothetical protein